MFKVRGLRNRPESDDARYPEYPAVPSADATRCQPTATRRRRTARTRDLTPVCRFCGRPCIDALSAQGPAGGCSPRPGSVSKSRMLGDGQALQPESGKSHASVAKFAVTPVSSGLRVNVARETSGYVLGDSWASGVEVSADIESNNKPSRWKSGTGVPPGFSARRMSSSRRGARRQKG